MPLEKPKTSNTSCSLNNFHRVVSKNKVTNRERIHHKPKRTEHGAQGHKIVHKEKAMLSGKGSNSGNDKGDDKRNNNNKKQRRGSNSSSSSMHQSTPSSSKKDLLKQLPEDFEPGDYDVVCSRGKWAMNAPGNVRYRGIIKDNLQKYSATTSKQEKSAIVSEIVESIQELSPQGGFVRSVDGRWYTVTDHIAREKTGQSFRDLLHTQYRSSTKAKRRRQKEKDLKDTQSMAAAAQGKTVSSSRAASAGASRGVGRGSGMTLGDFASGVMASGSSGGRLPAGPAFSLASASSQVFPSIPNHSNNMMRAQLVQQHPPPHPPMNMFSGNPMAMAQHQQQQLQHFMYDLNHMQQNFPIHQNIALPNIPYVQAQQEQRIAIGDLEPIPIREPAGPLMPQQHQQPLPEVNSSDNILPHSQSHGSLNQAQLPPQLQLPLQHHHQLHHQEDQHSQLPQMQNMLQESQVQHQLQQHPQPQSLRQQLEPIPLLEHQPALADWEQNEDENPSGKGNSFEGMMGGTGFAQGRRHDDHDGKRHDEED